MIGRWSVLGLLVASVALGQDGQPPLGSLVFTTGAEREHKVMRLDLASGKVSRLLPEMQRSHVVTGASPRGSRLVVSFDDGTLGIVDERGKAVPAKLPEHTMHAAMLDEQRALLTVARIKPPGHRVVRLTLADGAIEEVYAAGVRIVDDGPLKLAPGNAWASYTVRGAGGWELCVLDLAKGKATTLPGITYGCWLGGSRLMAFHKGDMGTRIYDAMPPVKVAKDLGKATIPIGQAGEGWIALARLPNKEGAQVTLRHVASGKEEKLGQPFPLTTILLVRPLVHEATSGRLFWAAPDENKRWALWQATPKDGKLGGAKRLHAVKEGQFIAMLTLAR